MNKIIRIIIILFVSIAGVGLYEKPANAETIEGIWIDQNYLMVLKNSLSPKAASSASETPSITIDKDRIFLSLHFHESEEYQIKTYEEKTGKIILKDNGLIDSVVLSAGNLIVNYKINNESITAKFIKLPSNVIDEEQYLSQIVLSGRYRDKDNNEYVFQNGNVIWNGKAMKYFILFDYVEFMPLSSICVTDNTGKNKVWYGFVTNGRMLQLYEYDDDAKKIIKLILDLEKERL